MFHPFTDTRSNELKVYRYNYQILNKVGSEIVISYSEFGRLEKIALNSDDILDWFRIFKSTFEPEFTLVATLHGSGIPLLLNGQKEYKLTTVENPDTLVVIPVTIESK